MTACVTTLRTTAERAAKCFEAALPQDWYQNLEEVGSQKGLKCTEKLWSDEQELGVSHERWKGNLGTLSWLISKFFSRNILTCSQVWDQTQRIHTELYPSPFSIFYFEAESQ